MNRIGFLIQHTVILMVRIIASTVIKDGRYVETYELRTGLKSTMGSLPLGIK
jgi:hypothetical protein